MRRWLTDNRSAARLSAVADAVQVVVEQRDHAGVGPAGVVLAAEARAAPHPEVAPLAAEAPCERAALAVDLVHRARVTRRDQQVAVRPHVDRVQMEVVERLAALGTVVALLEGDGVEAVPLEQQAPRRDVDLLDHVVEHLAVALASDGAQVASDRAVGGHQRRPLRGDRHVVDVGAVAADGADAPDLAIRLVEQHVLAVPPPGGEAALPVGEHRPTAVGLDVDVEHLGAGLARLEPHRAAAVIGDQDAVWPRPVVAPTGVEEEEARRPPGAPPGHDQPRCLDAVRAVAVVGALARARDATLAGACGEPIVPAGDCERVVPVARAADRQAGADGHPLAGRECGRRDEGDAFAIRMRLERPCVRPAARSRNGHRPGLRRRHPAEADFGTAQGAGSARARERARRRNGCGVRSQLRARERAGDH